MKLRALAFATLTLLLGGAAFVLLWSEDGGRRVPGMGNGSADNGVAGERSDYYMEGVESWQFDSEGRRQHSLQALRIEHFSASQRSLMQAPRIRVHRPGDGDWLVSAETAEGRHADNLFSLQTAVVLERAAAEGVVPLRMETETLRLNPQTRQADTDAAVRFASDRGQMTATGLRADLASERLQLLHKVHARYVR